MDGKAMSKTLHLTTFEYHQPTKDQILSMEIGRRAALDYAHKIELIVPDGPDKTYILRKLREMAMWVNVAVTREADGTPRE